MDRDCLLIEELERLPELPEEDPRRRHVESCPRCSARLASLRLFEDPSQPAEGARVEEAGRHLDAYLQRLSAPRRRGLPRPVAWLGVAAVAAGILLVVLGDREEAPRVSSQVRGDPAAPRALSAGEARWSEEGSLLLRWDAPDPGTPLEVVFVDLALVERARFPVTQQGRLELSDRQLPPSLSSGETLLWSVVTRREGEELAITAQAPLTR